jgi:hypothetical protein
MSKARDLANAGTALTTVSATELGYLDGVTSAVQTQVDAKIAKTLTTTTGDIIYASSANTPARLGIGSTDQVLKVTGGVPAWATPAASGSMTELASGSLPTGAAVLTLSSISSSYKNLQLVLRNPHPMGSFKLNNDSAANRYSQAGVNMVNTASAVQGDLTTLIYGAWNAILTTSQSNVQILNIYDYANTSSFKVFDVMSMGVTTTSAVGLWASNGAYRSASAVNRIDYTADSNYGGGTYILYGVN